MRRAYTHGAEYWSERIVMMQAWADYLDELREAGRAYSVATRELIGCELRRGARSHSFFGSTALEIRSVPSLLVLFCPASFELSAKFRS